MINWKDCPYRGKGFSDENVCIIDPEHFTIDDLKFDKIEADTLKKKVWNRKILENLSK
ncbi:MAG: hypothetical protein KJ906_01190 [Nanoarchaeota archaeon]|nr:hypothetical protein [Nanoarchaeota archaeon]